jgi:membrane protein
MSKQAATQERPSHKKTHDAVQRAITEVQHAVRPRRENRLTWMLALGAGAIVAWRGLQVALEDPPVRRGRPINGLSDLAPLNQRSVAARPLATRQESPGVPRALSAERRQGEHFVERSDDASLDARTPSPPVDGSTRKGAIGLVKEFIARYNDDDCPARAAALSFFGVLSLVPLLLFAVAALGFFIRDPNQAQQYVEHVVATLLPGREATQAADQVIQQTHVVDSARSLMNGKWWTVLAGFLSLIYAVLGLFVSATDPMNAAWEVKETRNFIRLRVVCLEVFAGAGLFFLLSLVVSSDLWHPAGAPWAVNALLSLLYEGVAVVLNAVMFTLIYRFLPDAKVTWRAAAAGGIVTGVLYEVVKKGFELYLSHFGNFNNKMYGTLGGIVLLVTWIYYSSMLLLSGAIIAKMIHEHKEEGGVRHRAA